MKKLVLGILAHVDAGKTTLSEALLYTCGSIRKLGRVDHRDTALDTHRIERERGITVFSKQAQLRTDNMELCLLDTPGHADLTAETERTLDVIDCALLVISGSDGVQAHTETLWRLLERRKVPTIIFATKMDLTASDRQRILSDLRTRLSENCFDLSDRSQDNRESIAMCDEELFEKLASGGNIGDGDISRLIAERKLFPVLYGSGLRLDGVHELIEFIEKYAPSPVYPENFGARVYKIMRDVRGRRLSCMKITGGALHNRDSIDGRTVTELRVYSGANYETVQSAAAGSIVAVQGLDDSYAGQGLGFENDRSGSETEAVMSYRIELPEGADALSAYKQLRQLEDEDPQLRMEWNERLREISVRIMGRVQTEVLTELIRERFDLDVSISSGGIAYKETVAAPVYGVGHFEPLRHYAEVQLLIEPAPRGSGLSFESRCPTDELDRNWQSLIMTNLAEKTHLGVLTGSPLTDVRISLIAGRAHIKHTEGGDFREAVYRAVRQGLMKAESVLLEPCFEFRLELPPEQIGRAISDVRAMSGSFDTEGSSVIKGIAPVSEMNGYAETLASYTSGKGRLSCRPAGYYPCHNAKQVIETIGYEPESDIDNTADSVFCSHGAGTTVKWNEVERFAHIAPKTAGAAPEAVQRPRYFSIDDKELEAIMEREFGPVRRRMYTKVQTQEAPEFSVAPSKREYVIVDGYNFIFGTPEYKELAEASLSLARERLSDTLRSYRAMRDCELVLVFDGYRVAGNTGERETQGIRTVYTKENETADMYIEKLANDIGKNYSVKVVTNDSLIRLSAMRSGVLRMSVKEFSDELDVVMKKSWSILMENDELIRRAEDLSRRCEKTASVTHTAFLTPAEQFTLEKWARESGSCMLLTGGAEGCERRAAFFLPFYMDKDGFDASEYISALRAAAHFGSPGHRDYMGAILGLGIKHEWLGDIWTDGEGAVIFVMQSVEQHIAGGLTKVGRYGVKLQKAELKDLTPPERKVKQVSFSVKSLRFDAVLAGMFGLSRTAAASLISEGAASLNYSECLKNDAAVTAGDVISLRGHGKGTLLSSGGLSRKGRLFVEAEIYK